MTAITDKTTLLARASSWLDDPAWWADEREGFLQLVNSDLKAYFARTPIRQQETETVLTGTVDSRFIDLPADFEAPISLHLTSFDAKEERTQLIAGRGFPYGVASGIPTGWAIDNTKIVFDVPCESAYTFDFRYVSNFTLSDSSTTNWLLTNHPSIYLDGLLSKAYAFRKDRQMALDHMALMQQALRGVTRADNAAKAKGARLVVDPGLMGAARFNINEG